RPPPSPHAHVALPLPRGVPHPASLVGPLDPRATRRVAPAPRPPPLPLRLVEPRLPPDRHAKQRADAEPDRFAIPERITGPFNLQGLSAVELIAIDGEGVRREQSNRSFDLDASREISDIHDVPNVTPEAGTIHGAPVP